MTQNYLHQPAGSTKLQLRPGVTRGSQGKPVSGVSVRTGKSSVWTADSGTEGETQGRQGALPTGKALTMEGDRPAQMLWPAGGFCALSGSETSRPRQGQAQGHESQGPLPSSLGEESAGGASLARLLYLRPREQGRSRSWWWGVERTGETVIRSLAQCWTLSCISQGLGRVQMWLQGSRRALGRANPGEGR